MAIFTILTILAFLAGATVYIAYLNRAEILSWFKENRITRKESEELAFTLKTAIENGDIVYVQGIFDVASNSIRSKRVIRAGNVATDVSAEHKMDVPVYWY